MQTKSRRNKWKPKNRKQDSGDDYSVYTKAFWTPQKFGAASEVRAVSVEDYLKEKPQRQGRTSGGS
jgi:hypothetical protein